jgi:N-acetylmuramoyl-L-alanine amidase
VDISGTFDEGTWQAVTAFQRHFRPALVDGVADESTVETLQALLAKLVKNVA